MVSISRHAPPEWPGRPMCYRCFKPESVCICATVHPVDNRTGVLVLQHPRERHHPIGTARFVRLGLRNARVQICGPKDLDAMRRAERLPPDAALLYPHPCAREVATLTIAQRPSNLIVLDGTWNHAQQIYRASPWLHRLAHIRVAPERPSQYRIRREPRAECLSTIEALVLALGHLEPETAGLDDLLDAFATMIDRQISLRQQSLAVRRRRTPRPRRPPIPRAFIEGAARLVVV